MQQILKATFHRNKRIVYNSIIQFRVLMRIFEVSFKIQTKSIYNGRICMYVRVWIFLSLIAGAFSTPKNQTIKNIKTFDYLIIQNA